MLKFFQAEFKNAIKNESLDEIIHNADRLKEYLDKIQLYQADRKHLNAGIKYLRNTAYDMLVGSSETSDENWVKSHFEEWLGQDFETLNNHLETVIKNPQEIKIRTISTPKKNKGFFEFLNKVVNHIAISSVHRYHTSALFHFRHQANHLIIIDHQSAFVSHKCFERGNSFFLYHLLNFLLGFFVKISYGHVISIVAIGIVFRFFLPGF